MWSSAICVDLTSPHLLNYSYEDVMSPYVVVAVASGVAAASAPLSYRDEAVSAADEVGLRYRHLMQCCCAHLRDRPDPPMVFPCDLFAAAVGVGVTSSSSQYPEVNLQNHER